MSLKINIKERTKMEEMEIEYEILTMLAEKRWIIITQLADIDTAIAKNSDKFYIDEDGLVELGIGIFR
jgi:hypothetical protein